MAINVTYGYGVCEQTCCALAGSSARKTGKP
jgi:hypothetical protein